MVNTNISGIFSSILLLMVATEAFSQEAETLKLLAPRMDHNTTLLQALQNRSSARSFSSEKLSLQTLSNLLWSACGVNRPESGKRTAPSANNKQEVEVYVFLSEGVYLYDAKAHELKLVLKEDLRGKTGQQDYVAQAPVNFVYIADLSKRGGEQKEKEFYSAVDTGFIGQNVYLCCAAEGLATVVRGSVDRPALEQSLNLRPEQFITLAQTIGYLQK